MSSADTTSAFQPGPRFRRWLNRRLPATRRLVLTQRSVFIFPSREGLLYSAMLVLLMLAAINYQNSLIFALAFTLGSLFLVAILHTFRNLSGLELEAGAGRAAFAGEDAAFRLRVNNSDRRPHLGIRLGWPGGLAQMIDLAPGASADLLLHVPAGKRGWMNPGRLSVETRYPLGLLRAWSWVDLDVQVLVYPRPVLLGRLPAGTGTRAEGEMLVAGGSDDFQGLRNYQAGDPPRRVDWKSWARGAELQVKEYGGYVDRRLWLDWAALPGMDTEQRLSRLCGWALEAHRLGDEYGLRLPQLELPPGAGEQHRDQVLRALAVHGLGTPGASTPGASTLGASTPGASTLGASTLGASPMGGSTA